MMEVLTQRRRGGSVPVLPVCLTAPLWVQFAALLPERPAVAPTHPLGRHRRRIPDRVVFDHVLAVLVHGSGYERHSSPGCSDRTIRRRLHEWAALGIAEQLPTLALAAYDRMIGLDLEDLAADGGITKAPAGGAAAGRSPVDRGKQGLKRSVVTDAAGIPLHLVSAGAKWNDSPLLGLTLAGLDRLPQQLTVTSTGPMTSSPLVRCWPVWAWTAPSPVRAYQRRYRRGCAGWSSVRTPG